MAVDPERVAQCPWRLEPYDASRFAGIRSMLIPEERRMLVWLSHNTGEHGCIIDAGAFLGGSTVHLADGILENPNAGKKVHSFDLFEVSPYAREHFDLEGVESTLPLYATNIVPWADRIIVYPGDITQSGWQPQPIDILFLDCLKNRTVGDWAAQRFFPSLEPGSILIQQDFLHPSLPWIHVAMGYFGDHFRYLADTGINSVIYVCEKPIPANDFSFDRLPLDTKLACFDAATEPFTDPKQREILDAARARAVALVPAPVRGS